MTNEDKKYIKNINPYDGAKDVIMFIEDMIIQQPLTNAQKNELTIKVLYWMSLSQRCGILQMQDEFNAAMKRLRESYTESNHYFQQAKNLAKIQ